MGTYSPFLLQLLCLQVSLSFLVFDARRYATSLCAAEKISQSILAGEPGAVEGYLKFLSSGCSKDPLDLLADASSLVFLT